VWLQRDAASSHEPDLVDDTSAELETELIGRRAGANGVRGLATILAMALATALTRAPKTGTNGWLLLLATITAVMIAAAGTVPDAVVAFRSVWRPIAGHVFDARRRAWLKPFVSDKTHGHLASIGRNGIPLHLTGPRDQRREAPPLESARERSGAFWSKTWKLIRGGRILALTRVAAREYPIVPSPVGATAKHDSNGAETGKWGFSHHLSKGWGGASA
jgi:hypothetical protein